MSNHDPDHRHNAAIRARVGSVRKPGARAASSEEGDLRVGPMSIRSGAGLSSERVVLGIRVATRHQDGPTRRRTTTATSEQSAMRAGSSPGFPESRVFPPPVDHAQRGRCVNALVRPVVGDGPHRVASC
jgi:hypothetical protein